MNFYLSLLLYFGTGLLASLILTPAVKYITHKKGWVARPKSDRWHKRTTALHGGVAMYTSFIIGYLIYKPTEAHGDFILVSCATGMFLLGLIDDFLNLKPYIKLIVQLSLSILLTLFGLSLTWTGNNVIDKIITIFWLTGITNALNLLDNIDGATAGISLIASLFMVFFLINGGQNSEAVLLTIFAGSVAGFLVYNFHPASIFMGDSGSLFLGFFLAGSGLISNTHKSRGLLGVIGIPILVMLVPILDTTLVTISRKLEGRSIAQGGKDHTSHRLVSMGLSEKRATLTLYALAIISGAIAVALRIMSYTWALGILLLFLVSILLFFIYMQKIRFESEGVKMISKKSLKRIFIFIYKTKILEVITDLILTVTAYYLAFLLRFEGNAQKTLYSVFIRTFPIVISVELFSFIITGIYGSVWKYLGITDLLKLAKSIIVSVILASVAVFYIIGFHNVSRSVFIINGIILFIFMAGTRYSFRIFETSFKTISMKTGKPILIYGAGDGGELFLREILNNKTLRLNPVGFIDDDSAKHGSKIHTVPILGGIDSVEDAVMQYEPQAIVVTIQGFPDEKIKKLKQIAEKFDITVQKMGITIENL